MKAYQTLFALIAITGTSAAAVAEVVVKQAPLTWSDAAITDGGDLYQELCAVCHGKDARGDGPAAGALKKPVPGLTRLAAMNGGEFPREALKRQIDGREQIDVHGAQQMPVWGYEFWIDAGAGSFSEEQVTATLDKLVDHLESIQVTAATESPESTD